MPAASWTWAGVLGPTHPPQSFLSVGYQPKFRASVRHLQFSRVPSPKQEKILPCLEFTIIYLGVLITPSLANPDLPQSREENMDPH